MKKTIQPIVAGLVVLVFFASAHCQEHKETIPPKAAGTFYSADAAELSSQIEYFFLNVPTKILTQDPIALLVPHAGLAYSGQIAAAAYYEVKGRKYDAVILVGPSHHEAVSVASIYPAGEFQIPLGAVPIDEVLAKKITQGLPGVTFDPRPYAQEHSLEVQLPFLHKIFPGAKVVEILVGPMNLQDDRRVAEAIAKACEGRKVLLIASSDMSHYPKGSDATRVDENSLNMVRRFDPELLPGYTNFVLGTGVENLSCVLCGDGALVTVMEAARLMGANESRVLAYANSADVTGESGRAVGYGAVAFFKDSAKPALGAPDTLALFKDPEGRQQVLALARSAIEGYAGSQKTINVALENPEFFRPQQVFVTLKKNGQLRGCIGNPNHPLPLYEAVVRMAKAAGFEDYRFSPLTAPECKEIKIEISVLGNFQRVKSAEEIVMRKHGVIVNRDGRQGLFLPEVADMLPVKEQFLSRLCEEKAGLPADAWKDPKTELWTFTSTHFAEEEAPPEPLASSSSSVASSVASQPPVGKP